MSSTGLHIVAGFAGLALLTTGLFVFPGSRMGLAKGLAVSVALAVFAAVLVTAVRNLGP